MTHAHRRLLNLVLAFTLAAFGTHAASLSAQPDSGGDSRRDDLNARRGRLMEKLGSGSMAILWSAPARVTDTELIRLSAKVPRTAQELDDFMRTRK